MSETTTLPPPILLPTAKDLPCDDGIPMETQRHKWQMALLLETLYPWLEAREDGYISGNMFVYFRAAQVRNKDFRGPDFFAVLGVPKRERLSWVVWEEGKGPDLVIELLSETTAEQDKNEKKQIYQDQLRVPEYFWYDPFNPEDWAGFTLRDGVYRPLERDTRSWYISQQLGLALVTWFGSYRGIEAVWLRWATIEGKLLPTGHEFVREEQQKATQAEQKAAKLAARLQEMGINPEAI